MNIAEKMTSIPNLLGTSWLFTKTNCWCINKHKSEQASPNPENMRIIFYSGYFAWFQLNDFELRKGKKLGVTISFNNHRLFVGNIPKNRDRDELLEEVEPHSSLPGLYTGPLLPKAGSKGATSRRGNGDIICSNVSLGT